MFKAKLKSAGAKCNCIALGYYLEEVFNGTGLRSGRHDGIVNAISAVLEVQEKNTEELKKQISSVAQMSKGLADNFSSMDEWLSKNISRGNTATTATSVNISDIYKAYLEENNILDDVKDVMEAYDLQVEEASNRLSQSLLLHYNDLIQDTQNRLNRIMKAIEHFKTCIYELEKNMHKNVTSTYYKTQINDNGMSEKVKITERHGALSGFFPSEIRNSISHSKTHIIPLLNPLYDSVYTLNLYNSGIYNLKEYLSSVIEKAVYDSMELDSIITAQNLVSVRILRMIQEVQHIGHSISTQFKSNSLTSYHNELQSVTITLNNFNLMLNDCFGKNVMSA